jgi:hypothetical protein
VALQAPRTLAVTLAVLVASACSSSLVLTVPPVAKHAPPELAGAPRARVGQLTGNACFRDEVTRYLSVPGGLQQARDDDGSALTLTGGSTRIEVHSNRGDKEVAMLYFTAFVVTAPIAAAMYGAKDWHADATADGELAASDARGAVIWRKSLTVSIAESQRTMPSQDALSTAMSGAVCQKLATTLLNGLAEYLVTRR